MSQLLSFELYFPPAHYISSLDEKPLIYQVDTDLDSIVLEQGLSWLLPEFVHVECMSQLVSHFSFA